MRTSFPPIAALLAFDAVARRRSFTLAAGELHLTPSAVSHQIARLEAFVGQRLLERSARAVQLTEAGDAYLQRVTGALRALGAATDDLREGRRSTLYVHASPSFASLWLMPRLADFAQAHPDVSLFLSASHTHSDFSQGLVDLDVRYGLPTWPSLVIKPLFTERILPLASPALLERHRVRTPEALLHLPLIQSTVSVVQWSDWLAARGVPRTPERWALRFDRAQLALDAAEQGLGIALESSTIASPHIEAGRLVPVFDPKWALPVQAHFVVYPERHAQRPEVIRFLEWLALQTGKTRTGPGKTARARSRQAGSARKAGVSRRAA